MSPSTDPAEGREAWPAAWAAALSDPALVAASSAAVFARGQDCARSGAVRDLDDDPMPEPAMRARVVGTSVYAVEVWIESDALAGDGDCPHAADGWFCKHQVAVALAWRERLTGGPASDSTSAPVPPPGRAPRTVLEKRQALHAFLHGQDAATLADKLLDLAARNRAVERELQQWRKLGELGDDWPGVRRIVSAMLAPGREHRLGRGRGLCRPRLGRARRAAPGDRPRPDRGGGACPSCAAPSLDRDRERGRLQRRHRRLLSFDR